MAHVEKSLVRYFAARRARKRSAGASKSPRSSISSNGSKQAEKQSQLGSPRLARTSRGEEPLKLLQSQLEDVGAKAGELVL